MTGIGENTLAQPVKPPLRERRACLAKLVKNRLTLTGGAEALRPRPKGRPRGSRSKPRARTREQELEERCRRLEAEVAYLKKLRALVERDGL